MLLIQSVFVIKPKLRVNWVKSLFSVLNCVSKIFNLMIEPDVWLPMSHAIPMYRELLCRDFFRLSSVKYGDKIFYINGPWGRSFYPLFSTPDWEWKRDRELFQKWCDGKTGYPFIDAAMIELKATGFMSNRMRQNCANFLVKDMQIDWRWGAEWFESLLLDYDAAQNYCNWNYIAV